MIFLHPSTGLPENTGDSNIPSISEKTMPESKKSRATAVLRWATIPVALVASSALVFNASHAAFSANTTNGVNNWTAGSLALVDDDVNVAMFNVTGLKPGSTGSKCINVTYNGDIAAAVKLYGTGVTGTLGSYLNLTVEEGTGGTTASCTGFTGGTSIYSGTLAAFGTGKTDFATGIGSFAPTGSAQSKSYRFTYTLADNNLAQGQTASATFKWEAQA